MHPKALINTGEIERGVACLSNKHQEGYVLVFVMLLFVIIAVICSSALNVAYLERKQSQYDFEQKQAEQAAEAGIAWAQEAIYACLCAHDHEETIPHTALASMGPVQLGPNGLFSYSIEEPGAVLEEEEDDSCVYKFICLGKGISSQYRTVIKCEFNYINYYKIDRFGKKVFICRIFEDRGKTVSYQVIYY